MLELENYQHLQAERAQDLNDNAQTPMLTEYYPYKQISFLILCHSVQSPGWYSSTFVGVSGGVYNSRGENECLPSRVVDYATEYREPSTEHRYRYRTLTPATRIPHPS